jgi:hypothetical protein
MTMAESLEGTPPSKGTFASLARTVRCATVTPSLFGLSCSYRDSCGDAPPLPLRIASVATLFPCQ